MTEWWKIDRASTMPSTWVTVTHTSAVAACAQRPRAGGAVQVEGVADPPVAGGDHHGVAVDHHAQMADQPGVEHLVQVLACRCCPGRFCAAEAWCGEWWRACGHRNEKVDLG